MHLCLYFIGPLIKTKYNNKYIMVTVDYFTKWVEAEPTENITSKDLIKVLINVFDLHEGTPGNYIDTLKVIYESLMLAIQSSIISVFQ